MLQKLFSWFSTRKKENPVDTRIYSQSNYTPVILDQETPIIPNVFPSSKETSIGKEEKFDPGVMFVNKPETGQ